MNAPAILIYTQDTALATRCGEYLRAVGECFHTQDPREADGVLDRMAPAVVILDLRSAGARDQLGTLLRRRPPATVIALGVPRSDPWMEAETLGAYAVEDTACDRRRLQSLAVRAAEHLHLMEENRLLREERTRWEQAPASARPDTSESAMRLHHLSPALRHFDNVEELLEHMVEGLGSAVMIARAGIFSRPRNGTQYRLRAGLRCLPETWNIEYDAGDPLIRWIEKHAHLVSRASLGAVEDPAARLMLRRALDALGAEILLPLQAHGRLLGWLFVGHHATGLPFDYGELEALTRTAEHMAVLLENAMLYEEVSFQKTLADAMIHALPVGIVAVDESAIVRWFNHAAEAIFGLSAQETLNRSVSTLGSRIEDRVRRALRGEGLDQAEEWIAPFGTRVLTATARRLGANPESPGVLLLIEDVTVRRDMLERQEQVARSAFWNELAAGMSHEIRNPLVAIKTFAQLLPERYADADFRNEFSRHVSDEVDRLNAIIEQIDQFAHPPALEMRTLDLRKIAAAGLEAAVPPERRNGVKLLSQWPDDLPPVRGDERALTECVAQLVRNSVEASAGRPDTEIRVAAQPVRVGDEIREVAITVRDNGPGIAADNMAKVFSPFYTTKARGMGLGLPIVKRTVLDHGGRLMVDSNGAGACVTIVLPAAPREALHEASAHRG